MILLSASKVWLWVQRDGGIWSFLTWTKSHFVASPASGNESWGGEGGDPSDSPRKSLWPCRIGCSRSWSPPINFIRPSATHLQLKKWVFHFLWRILLPLHWVFQSRFLMRPSFPTPQCLQPICHPSKFSPRTKRIQGVCLARLSSQIDGFLIGLSQT